MKPSPNSHPGWTGVNRWAALVILVVGVWLAWAAYAINIDFDDGYVTLVNSGYLLGERGEHFYNRGPGAAFALIPARLIARWLGLHPMDVRIAHAFTALAVLACLIGTWRLLVRIQPRDGYSLAAFVGAMLTPVFFSYAPFINLDVAPAVLVLWMLVLVDQQLNAPRPGRWWLLVLLGAALALIKQTYALVWIGIVVVLPLLLAWERAGPSPWLGFRRLVAAAAMSGLITWVVYAWVLYVPFADEPWWLRPWLQIETIGGAYDREGGARAVFYFGTYFQNLSAYGLLAALLVLPGVLMALRSESRVARLIAAFWLFFVLALHLTPYKEVRYLAILAPLNAVLIAPVLRRFAAAGLGRTVAALALLGGFGLAVPEALRLRQPYYRDAVMEFLEPLPLSGEFKWTLITGDPLSFVSPEPSAFYADRYHRITHVMALSILSLYGYSPERAWMIGDVKDVAMSRVQEGDYWFLNKPLVVRQKPFVRGNLQGLAQDYFRILARAEWLDLKIEGTGYSWEGRDQRPYVFIGAKPGIAPLLAGSGHIEGSDARRLWGWEHPPESPRVLAFRVLRDCNMHQCRRFD